MERGSQITGLQHRDAWSGAACQLLVSAFSALRACLGGYTGQGLLMPGPAAVRAALQTSSGSGACSLQSSARGGFSYSRCGPAGRGVAGDRGGAPELPRSLRRVGGARLCVRLRVCLAVARPPADRRGPDTCGRLECCQPVKHGQQRPQLQLAPPHARAPRPRRRPPPSDPQRRPRVRRATPPPCSSSATRSRRSARWAR